MTSSQISCTGKPARNNGRSHGATMISIVLPIYNREATIERAVNSVIAQIFTQWELLCVDDGSTDRSVAIVQDFCRRDSRIKLHQVPHGGVAAARNEGLSQAVGQIISYLDSDNSWRSNYLLDVWQTLRGRVGSSCYAAMRVNILDDKDQIVRQSTLLQRYDRRRILRRNQIDMNTFSHTSDLIAAFGPFDAQMTRLCDWELILRYTQRLNPIRIDSIGADYYHHRSENRVSMNAEYAPNRLKISLRSHRVNELRAVFVGDDHDDYVSLLAVFESCGFPTVTLGKDEFDDFQLQAADIVFWQGCEWDTDEAAMTSATVKMEFDCTLSFYLLKPTQDCSTVSLATFNRMHFVVCDNDAHKQRFQQYMFALQETNNQVDVNPLDRILIQNSDDHPAVCLNTFANTIVGYQLAQANQTYSIFLDNSAKAAFSEQAETLAATLGSADNTVRHNDKRQLNDIGDGVVVYITKHFVPAIPAKQETPRLLMLLGDDLGLDAVQISQFDAVLFDTRASAIAYSKEYPMMRVFYGESTITERLSRLIRVATGDLVSPGALNLPKHEVPRLVYLAGNKGASSTRKRCHEMVTALQSVFPTRIVDQKRFELRQLVSADIVIVQRWVERYGDVLEDFFNATAKLKLAGKIFVYDLDDHVLDYSQGLPKTFLSISDYVSCSTPYLQQQLSRYHGGTYYAANMVEIGSIKIRPISSHKRVRRVICVSTDGMGYEAICEIAKKANDKLEDSIEFVFVSALELEPNEFVTQTGQLSWEALFDLMCDSEVMLNLNEMSAQLDARLSGNGQLQYNEQDFIHSKSAIKYHDSALAGIPLITSNAPQQFSEWIESGKTGIVVNSHEEMLQQLLTLLNKPSLGKALALNARADVFERHTQAAHWHKLSEQMISMHQSSRRLAHNWHQENLSTVDTTARDPKNVTSRYARMLELGTAGEKRAAQNQDTKRLKQLAAKDREIDLLRYEIGSKKDREIDLLKRQLSSKEAARASVQKDLDISLQRLSHYQQPFLKRLISAIKFRINKS